MTRQRPQRPDWQLEPETRMLRQLHTATTDVELSLSRRMGLGQTDLAAMSHLTFAGERLGPSQLSQRLGVSPAATTQVVDRLERAGHVVRQRDPLDRRRVHLALTESAQEEVRRQLWPVLTAMDQVTLNYSEEERRVIMTYLAAIVAVHREFDADPPVEDQEPVS